MAANRIWYKSKYYLAKCSRRFFGDKTNIGGKAEHRAVCWR